MFYGTGIFADFSYIKEKRKKCTGKTSIPTPLGYLQSYWEINKPFVLR
jgi:hypothetical protein